MKKWGILLLILGVLLVFGPSVNELRYQAQSSEKIEQFRNQNDTESAETGDRKSRESVSESETGKEISETSSPSFSEKKSVDLLTEAQNYNRLLYESGQTCFCDTSSVLDFPESLSDLPEMFGYLEIPAMNLELPLYLGATNANLAKGAAVLGETSLPVGGSNTNAVIAGHRGYRGIPFFREIEKLNAGDRVYITNPWEQLSYQVESIAIIDPTDSDAVKIQSGKDMVTLITCHPYRSHGKYRYVVFCTRVPDTEQIQTAETDIQPEEEEIPDHTENGGMTKDQDPEERISSGEDIRQEKQLRIIGLILTGGIVFFTFFRIAGQSDRKNR